MKFISTLALSSAAFLAAATAGAEAGRTTWYSDWSRGHCGVKHGEYVAALPTSVFNKVRGRCGDWLEVSYKGKSVRVQFVDECADGCKSMIDLSKPAFEKLAPLSAGVIDATYRWVNGGDDDYTPAPPKDNTPKPKPVTPVKPAPVSPPVVRPPPVAVKPTPKKAPVVVPAPKKQQPVVPEPPVVPTTPTPTAAPTTTAATSTTTDAATAAATTSTTPADLTAENARNNVSEVDEEAAANALTASNGVIAIAAIAGAAGYFL